MRPDSPTGMGSSDYQSSPSSGGRSEGIGQALSSLETHIPAGNSSIYVSGFETLCM